MNIVDSSAWIEYFANTQNAKNFSKVIEDQNNVLIPSIILYEVFKKIMIESDENNALQIIAHMKQCRIVNLDLDISLFAAKLGKEFRLPMADSIIFATAKRTNSVIWTQDVDFKGLENVKYFKKK